MFHTHTHTQALLYSKCITDALGMHLCIRMHDHRRHTHIAPYITYTHTYIIHTKACYRSMGTTGNMPSTSGGKSDIKS
jgi:hypothetical protein